MPRARRGFKARRRRNRIMKAARGFYGARSRLFAPALEAVRHAWRYSTRDRKVRKREFRRLWIVRISAAVRAAGTRYSNFAHGLKKANVELDRKVLADLALHEPETFSKVVEVSQQAK